MKPGAAKASDTESAKSFAVLPLCCDQLALASPVPLLHISLEVVTHRLRRGRLRRKLSRTGFARRAAEDPTEKSGFKGYPAQRQPDCEPPERPRGLTPRATRCSAGLPHPFPQAHRRVHDGLKTQAGCHCLRSGGAISLLSGGLKESGIYPMKTVTARDLQTKVKECAGRLATQPGYGPTPKQTGHRAGSGRGQ